MSPELRRQSCRLMMSAEGNVGVLPTDLIFQIFSRLPSNSIAICRCVSKLWASLLRSPNFTELFLTQSATRPRLLFTIRANTRDWCLYSCPQPQISNKKIEPFVSVTAEFHMSSFTHSIFKMSTSISSTFKMSPSISGLIYSPHSRIVCNPRTRDLLRLPHPSSTIIRSFVGYDPIDKQFSILAICAPLPPLNSDLPLTYQILKLGSGNLSWRSLNCPLDYYPSKTSICINGILYFRFRAHNKIVCLDLNSEEFKFIDEPWLHRPKLLVNFKGKLGGIRTNWVQLSTRRYKLELSLWVLENVEKQEWSEHVYNLPPLSKLWDKDSEPYRILGVTGKGDIVLALRFTINTLYVYFFNLDKNILQKVKVEGLSDGQGHDFDGCVDYVEDLRVLT